MVTFDGIVEQALLEKKQIVEHRSSSKLLPLFAVYDLLRFRRMMKMFFFIFAWFICAFQL